LNDFLFYFIPINSDIDLIIAAAATQGETEQAEAKAAAKISLLNVEGHVTY
jgi:hypothetical protein